MLTLPSMVSDALLSLYHRHRYLSFLMKFALIVIIGVLLWNSNDARQFTSDVLSDASEIIRPDSKIKIEF